MKVAVAGFTHTGNYKSVNEDRIAWSPEQPLAHQSFMLCVADGMGGHRFPDIAAELFCATVRNTFETSFESFSNVSHFIDQCFIHAGAALQARFSPATKPAPGCAAIVAIYQHGLVSIGWIGDCRAYKISVEQITQLTRDHTEAERQIAEGLLARDQVQYSSARHMLTRALTAENRDSHPEIITQKFESNEILLLCSDGLTNELRDSQIRGFFDGVVPNNNLATTGNAILQQVLAGRAADNVSFLLCRF